MGEELEAAKAAKAVIDALASKSAVSTTIRAAINAAVLNLESGGALNAARANVRIALFNVMDWPERMDKAKAAIDAWIRELEAATQWWDH